MARIPAMMSLRSQTIITNPSDIISSILVYYTRAPKDVSELTYELMISLADTVSRYGRDRITLVDPIRKELYQTFELIFGAGATTVSVTTDSDDNVYYDLTIAVSVNIDGTIYSASKTTSVDENGALNFTPLE